MFRRPRLIVFTCAVACGLIFSSLPMRAAEANSLRAGTAKIDIKPKDMTGLVSVWAKPFTGVHDPIFARAVVIDNGVNSAAIVSLDLVEFGDTTVLRQRIQRELAIPVEHIIISVTHGHNAYAIGRIYEKGTGVKADKEKAMEYYEVAMAHGDSDAKPAVANYASGLYRDGYALLQAGKYESALPLLIEAADLGNADALKITGKK